MAKQPLRPIDPKTAVPELPPKEQLDYDPRDGTPYVHQKLPPLKPQPGPPDVTRWIREVNDRLAPRWEDNERRCGRAFTMDHATPVEEVAEVVRVFTGMGWRVIGSKEKAGIILTFRPPEAKQKPSDKRGRGGYL